MRVARLLARCATTVLQLPVAMAWDAVSLGNMGEGSSTGRVLREHQQRASEDELIEQAHELIDVIKRLDR